MKDVSILRMSGSCRSGGDNTGKRFHAVRGGIAYGYERALCGAKPASRGNGWSVYEGGDVTCPRCLEKQRKTA